MVLQYTNFSHEVEKKMRTRKQMQLSLMFHKKCTIVPSHFGHLCCHPWLVSLPPSQIASQVFLNLKSMYVSVAKNPNQVDQPCMLLHTHKLILLLCSRLLLLLPKLGSQNQDADKLLSQYDDGTGLSARPLAYMYLEMEIYLMCGETTLEEHACML